jgi:hypothetical protein
MLFHIPGINVVLSMFMEHDTHAPSHVGGPNLPENAAAQPIIDALFDHGVVGIPAVSHDWLL